LATDRQTDKQTNRQTDIIDGLSRYREWRLIVIIIICLLA